MDYRYGAETDPMICRKSHLRVDGDLVRLCAHPVDGKQSDSSPKTAQDLKDSTRIFPNLRICSQ